MHIVQKHTAVCFSCFCLYHRCIALTSVFSMFSKCVPKTMMRNLVRRRWTHRSRTGTGFIWLNVECGTCLRYVSFLIWKVHLRSCVSGVHHSALTNKGSRFVLSFSRHVRTEKASNSQETYRTRSTLLYKQNTYISFASLV